ncbi:chitin deacetylase 7-like [Babylonia areolata]|uniref:chitin deacetylase 7-like n=1 Tax=Babylonia areolata TaxID=304850 RepID=UPI003FD5FAAE
MDTPRTSTATSPPSSAERCHPTTCQLPDCRCVGTDIPGNLDPREVPQMILFTIDDEITANTFPYYQEIFPAKSPMRNPNGCRATATFFVSDIRSDMSMVKTLVERGNEVASHSLTHELSYKHAWSPAVWDQQIQGMRQLLAQGTGLPVTQIRGMRAPNLQLGGDVQYSMLKARGFLYDSSMYGGTLEKEDDGPPLWPFTLDYPPYLPTIHAVCDQSDCPTRGYPQLWEVPLVRLYTLDGRSCAMTDVCPLKEDANTTEIVAFLRHNFLRHYTRNRAPFMISIHPRWFTRVPSSYPALKQFLRNITQEPDVWQVTLTQMLDWVRDPKPLSRLHELPSWQCPQTLWEKDPNKAVGILFTFATFAVLFAVLVIVTLLVELRNAGYLVNGLKRPKGGHYKHLPSQDPDDQTEETSPLTS